MQVIEKRRVELGAAEFAALRMLGKIKQRIATWGNSVIERTAKLCEIAGNTVTLDQSRTKWEIKINGPKTDAELTYQGRIVATVIIAPTPGRVDTEKLREEFPDAYEACFVPGGETLRLNIKK